MDPMPENKVFANWREKIYYWNTIIAAGLFSLQIAHLFWLTTDVILPRVIGSAGIFSDSFLSSIILVFIDYTEIPALITVSLVYINSYRRKRNTKDVWYLILLNIQWLHIFWITDEVVLSYFSNEGFLAWGFAAAWFAILIDYLELPVIYETTKRALRLL